MTRSRARGFRVALLFGGAALLLACPTKPVSVGEDGKHDASQGAAPEPVRTPDVDVEPSPGPDPEPAAGVACGARAGDTCAADEYCAYEPGQICGWADATAKCKKKPEACTLEVDTVCGCDGKNHPNACAAAQAGTGVMAKRECKADGS